MGLTVKQEQVGMTKILTINGILDITTTNIVSSFLDNIEDIEVLIFDFSGLDFIDSTGIGSIINAIYLAKEKNFRLKLQGMNELTHTVFEAVGLYDVLIAIQEEAV
jgi:anti-anti-sigma factor